MKHNQCTGYVRRQSRVIGPCQFRFCEWMWYNQRNCWTNIYFRKGILPNIVLPVGRLRVTYFVRKKSAKNRPPVQFTVANTIGVQEIHFGNSCLMSYLIFIWPINVRSCAITRLIDVKSIAFIQLANSIRIDIVNNQDDKKNGKKCYKTQQFMIKLKNFTNSLYRLFLWHLRV